MIVGLHRSFLAQDYICHYNLKRIQSKAEATFPDPHGRSLPRADILERNGPVPVHTRKAHGDYFDGWARRNNADNSAVPFTAQAGKYILVIRIDLMQTDFACPKKRVIAAYPEELLVVAKNGGVIIRLRPVIGIARKHFRNAEQGMDGFQGHKPSRIPFKVVE